MFFCCIFGVREQVGIKINEIMKVENKIECNHNYVWDGISEPWEKDYVCTKCGDIDSSGSDSKDKVVEECEHEYECLLDTDYWSDYKCKKCGDYYMEEFD